MAKPKRIYQTNRDSGGQLFVAGQPGEHRFFSAELFRHCVRALAHAWGDYYTGN